MKVVKGITEGGKAHISVAPMMDWTDRHFRYFMRLISPDARLYTEMVTGGAILHGDRDRFLRFNETEHPIALQLGGSKPADLAACAKFGEEFGYDEINLNCGCPSDRVQNGAFGACLMKTPEHVAECVDAMQSAVSVPVTVKCRIGIDELDSFEFLDKFVDIIADKGCKTFIIHARKAWLKGLSPKENRQIPVLDYSRVYAIKEKHPHLEIILNGGLQDYEAVQNALDNCDGAMIGREAYQNPYFMAELEAKLFQNNNMLAREVIAEKMITYAEIQAKEHGTPIKSITRHILGLYHGQYAAKQWKRTLSTLPYEDGAGPHVIAKAIDAVRLAQEARINA